MPLKNKDGLTLSDMALTRLVAAGMSNEEIAQELGYTIDTVKSDLKRIFDKTGCNNRTRLAIWAFRKRLVALEPEPKSNIGVQQR